MAKEHSEPELLIEFMEGLKRAASAAHGLAHYQQNPAWLAVRNMLEACRMTGVKMAAAKAVPRQQVLKMLDDRSKMAGTA